MQNTLVKIPTVLGVDWAWPVKLNLISKSCLLASLLCLWNVCETCINIWKGSLLHILNGCTQILSPTASCHGPWDSWDVSLVWPLLASQSSTRRLAMYFQCFCRLSLNHKGQNFMHWETRRYFYRPRKHQANVISGHVGIPPDCVRLAEKLALEAFWLFPRPFDFMPLNVAGL